MLNKNMLNLYNTLTHKKEEFKSIKPNKVGMYCCGPTVYNFAHIGNLRTYIFEDILRRVLERNDYDVFHVMNITDVGHLIGQDGDDTGEDKMLAGAKREKKTVWDIAKIYTQAFLQDTKALNLKQPTIMPKATDHIQEMIDLILELQKKGFTYLAGGNIYFDTEKFLQYTDFANLSKQELDKSRVDIDENKKNPRDFALWFTKSKFDEQEMKWNSPFGIGYPGWHIECSAMSLKYLGDFKDNIINSNTFDIHCGGIDHIPVHHTNEIAQTECVTQKKMSNFWLHSEFLVILGGEKMAKSGNNFVTLKTVTDNNIDSLAFRYFTLGAHYRSKLNFNWEALHGAQNALNKIRDFMRLVVDEDLGEVDENYKQEFDLALNDDLNMPKALSVVWNLIDNNKILQKNKKATLLNFDEVLGLNLKEVTKIEIPEYIQGLAQQRLIARQEKKWQDADILRDKILVNGFIVEDTEDGFNIKGS